MRKALKLAVAVICPIFCACTDPAIGSSPTTFVGPILQGTYAGWLSSVTAYSLLAEAGVRDFRVSGTIGWRFQDTEQFKLSAEYLWQELNYNMFPRDTTQWEKQGALGADYQFSFYDRFHTTFDLSAYASRSPSDELITMRGIFRKLPFDATRHIAGATAEGMSSGFIFTLWPGSRLGLNLTYDHAIYEVDYEPHYSPTSFGGAVHFNQDLRENIRIGATASQQSLFHYYEADFNWTTHYWLGRTTWTLFGQYTNGREHLPSSYNLGLGVSLFTDRTICAPDGVPVVMPEDRVFLNWINDPAIYMPQVLTITDQSIT